MKEETSETQARAQLESIIELMEALREPDSDDFDTEEEYDAAYDAWDEDEAREAIYENALSLEVRSDWHTPGSEDNGPAEYRILLCTGGPAVQIVGDLNQFSEPETARLQHQDWFQPWTNLSLSDEEQETLLEYVQQHYFGS